MSPIRVAIIGLSSSAATSWASSAHLPYLLSPRGQQKYQIVALLNSSVDAARAAIKHYSLDPETVKPYGDPESLAADPEIDLVVNCTRVDVHYPTILPSVRAGKNVFVEWPLADNTERARELTEIIKKKGSRSIVGLQGRFAPPVVKLRQLLNDGTIGKVLSSEIRGYGGTNGRVDFPQALAYFADRSVGGNVYTIGFGHCEFLIRSGSQVIRGNRTDTEAKVFDQVQHVLGEFVDFKGHFHLQRPHVKIQGTETELTPTVPDLFITTARLASTPTTQKDAAVLYRFRRGLPYPGDPALVWTIAGEKGEIRLVSKDGTALHASAYSGPVSIEVHDFAEDKVHVVEWAWEDWQEELPMVAKSVAKLYDNYAAGESVTTFEDALSRHEQLEGALSTWTQ